MHPVSTPNDQINRLSGYQETAKGASSAWSAMPLVHRQLAFVFYYLYLATNGATAGTAHSWRWDYSVYLQVLYREPWSLEEEAGSTSIAQSPPCRERLKEDVEGTERTAYSIRNSTIPTGPPGHPTKFQRQRKRPTVGSPE